MIFNYCVTYNFVFVISVFVYFNVFVLNSIVLGYLCVCVVFEGFQSPSPI